jgi:hypothetical protein
MNLILITAATYAAFYYSIEPLYKDIRVVTSIINATLLSAFSILPTYQTNALKINEYITGFFLYDLLIGHFSDKKNKLGFLTGYVHHGVYIAVLTYVRYTDESDLIYIFLPFEVPTLLLDIKKLHPSDILDLAFGAFFFAFRILYNIYIIYVIPIEPYKLMPLITLCLHTHWFRLWLLKRSITIKESIPKIGQ